MYYFILWTDFYRYQTKIIHQCACIEFIWWNTVDSLLTDTSVRQLCKMGNSVDLVPAFLYFLYLTLCKKGISQRGTLSSTPKDVRLLESWLNACTFWNWVHQITLRYPRTWNIHCWTLQRINYGVQNTLTITNTSAKKPTDEVIEMIPVWNFHFAVKPVVTLQNVGCFLRQSNLEFQYYCHAKEQ